MRLLISAPCGEPECLGPKLYAAARSAGLDVLLTARAREHLEARRRWISRAADRVAATEDWMCARYLDRVGRPAVHQPLSENLQVCLDGLLSKMEE